MKPGVLKIERMCWMEKEKKKRKRKKWIGGRESEVLYLIDRGGSRLER